MRASRIWEPGSRLDHRYPCSRSRSSAPGVGCIGGTDRGPRGRSPFTASSSQAVFIYHGAAILILSVGLHPSQRWAVPWLLAIDNSSLPRLAEARARVGRLAPAFPGACQQRSPSAPQGLARQEGPGGWGTRQSSMVPGTADAGRR